MPDIFSVSDDSRIPIRVSEQNTPSLLGSLGQSLFEGNHPLSLEGGVRGSQNTGDWSPLGLGVPFLGKPLTTGLLDASKNAAVFHRPFGTALQAVRFLRDTKLSCPVWTWN